MQIVPLLRRALGASVYVPIEIGPYQALGVEVAAYGGRMGHPTAVGYPNLIRSSDGASEAKGSSGMETPAEFFQRRRDVIAENIARCLDEQGVSQNRLARMLDVAPSVIWDWVHARHAPSDPYLRRLEKVLDVPRGHFTVDHGEEDAA